MWRWLIAGLTGLLLLGALPGSATAGGAGIVTIVKVDGDTLESLGGSCFRIMYESMAELDIVCDNGPGDIASTEGVIWYDTGVQAVYFVQETQAPPGYSLNPTVYQCDATGDLMCSAYVGNTLSVGGESELPWVAGDGSGGNGNVLLGLGAGAVALLLGSGYVARKVAHTS